jgi:glycine/D-amino acid oxidase-like deaminating enzyme
MFRKEPRQHVLPSLSDVTLYPYWLDDTQAPETQSILTQHEETDLLVVGAGFTGLWTALLAKERDPQRQVIVIDAGESAHAASGRNGGFVHATLTHGFQNGFNRWPEELSRITAMGHENFREIENAIQRYGIQCDWKVTGELEVASYVHEAEELKDRPAIAAQFGDIFEWLDEEQVRARVDSPTFRGALFEREGVALVDPAQLAWGLRKACLSLGVMIFENSKVESLTDNGASVVANTALGSISARRVALATNAFPSFVPKVRRRIVPVYDYVLTTQPLSDSQWRDIRWDGHEGVTDAGNQFHYYRRTADNRILWGGYDAIYHARNGIGPQFENEPASYALLADHFFEVFPQLEGLKFSHAWGGAIDTCSRFSPFWGTTHAGKTAYVAGFTGLGVGASRFGASTMLDFLDDIDSEARSLRMVQTQPVPFPPEPFRSAAIGLTRWSLQRADANEGRRNLWLRLLDWLKLGFDS